MSHSVFTKRQFKEKDLALRPGDFIVTHGHSIFDRLIQIFTFSYWNHAALIVSMHGDIIELQLKGITKTHISEYERKNYYIIRLHHLSQEDRQHIISYAYFMLHKKAAYGFFTILTILFQIIFKSRFVIKLNCTFICSEFVANALSEGGYLWDKDTSLITPADLYNKFILHHYEQRT